MSLPTSGAALPSPATTASSPAPRRILACTSCQQRKLKCDRKFPCAKCIKADIQCVPAGSLPRTRRKRFAEKELLERLRRYEELLRQHDVPHVPLHGAQIADNGYHHAQVSPAASSGSHTATVRGGTYAGAHEAKDLWQAMNQTNGEESDMIDDEECEASIRPDVVHNAIVQDAYDEMYEGQDHLLFGAPHKELELTTLHPTSSQIFKLWQVFLDNVHPVLKVVHMSTLQARIVDAISDLTKPGITTHALMFGIYAMAVQSLDDEDCSNAFGRSRTALLKGYHFACQQALLRCGVLKSNERECLVALFLYLVSVRGQTDPRTVSSMLGILARLAQRLNVHSEAANSKYRPFEAEMRRRFWWALVIFDARISDMAGNKAAILMTPIWDCQTPLNVDDSQLWPNMQSLPVALARPSDALFLSKRSELDDFLRNSDFFLDFTNPVLKPLARSLPDTNLSTLERGFEREFENCNMENSIHYLTVWTVRGLFAKNHLLQYYSRQSNSTHPPTDLQRNEAVAYCLRMLEADTFLMTSPLTKGFRWLLNFNFPFPAYIHVIQDIRRRPSMLGVVRCWNTVSDNYEARFLYVEPNKGLFHKLIAKLIVRTWIDTQSQAGELVAYTAPSIVTHIAEKLGIKLLVKRNCPDSTMGNVDRSSSPTAEDLPEAANLDLFDGDEALQTLGSLCDLSEYAINFDFDDLQWSAFDMPSMLAPG